MCCSAWYAWVRECNTKVLRAEVAVLPQPWIPCRAWRHGNPRMSIVQVGELARMALARSGGVALPLTAFADTPYLEAAGEIIWVGARLPALHPRAVVTAAAQPRGVALHFDSLPDRGWSLRLPEIDEASANKVIAHAEKFRRILAGAQSARGFGALLAARSAEFPLNIATPRVRDLTAAYARNDPNSVAEASRALLGFGTGLTPSGDDLAGAALFGRRFVAPHDPDWAAAAETLSREIGTRSHAISAALFGDLARGQSFAPLHAVAEGLTNDDLEAAMHAARTLIEIGHSSGWDMITGFIIGITGTLP